MNSMKFSCESYRFNAGITVVVHFCSPMATQFVNIYLRAQACACLQEHIFNLSVFLCKQCFHLISFLVIKTRGNCIVALGIVLFFPH